MRLRLIVVLELPHSCLMRGCCAARLFCKARLQPHASSPNILSRRWPQLISLGNLVLYVQVLDALPVFVRQNDLATLLLWIIEFIFTVKLKDVHVVFLRPCFVSSPNSRPAARGCHVLAGVSKNFLLCFFQSFEFLECIPDVLVLGLVRSF
jgi:hypothetical protein